MSKRFAGLFVLALSFAGFAGAQEPDNPLKKAKVGDYAVYKMDNGQFKMSMKQSVTAVSDKEATLKVVTTFNGMEQPPQEQKIDLTKKFDPTEMMKQNKDVVAKETGKGEETIKVGGKDYKCNWFSYESTIKAGDMEIKSTSKVWICKDAPLYGMVKTESKTNFGGQSQNMVMELVESGNKK